MTIFKKKIVYFNWCEGEFKNITYLNVQTTDRKYTQYRVKFKYVMNVLIICK